MNSSENKFKNEGTLVISCDTVTPEHIILQILGVESLPDTVVTSCNVKVYPWCFETKYYSAEINLYGLEEKVVLDTDLCDTIRAVIFYFDFQKKTSFEDVLSWMPFVKDVEAEVQLLLCHNYNESDSSVLEMKKILDWCVENHYELVDLNSLHGSDDEDDTIKTAKGYGRVVEALQSHTWANLVMRGEKSNPSKTTEEDIKVPEEKSDTKEQDDAATDTENVEKDDGSLACSASASNAGCRKVAVEGEELQLEEKWLTNILNGEDPGGESFEALFSKFASMKDRASGLSGDDRKKYAEKVAIAFWRAMGGDENEIDGLDDLDD